MTAKPDQPTKARTNWKNINVKNLQSLASSKVGVDSLLKLRGSDGAAIVDVLDRALDLPNLEERLEKRYMYMLRRLCNTCGILPTSHTLPGGIEITSERPIMSGGYADVWIGRYGGQQVAIKALKIYASDDLNRVKRRFFKEALLWKRLSHPNVLPFLGVATLPQCSFCMVSSWMPHGTLVDYISSHPQANGLVLLSDVASGLDYLHKQDLVHGDLKGANILMNSDFRAVLADFGLVSLLVASALTTMATTGVGTVRWMAPELLVPEEYGFEHSHPSKESDVYAFGMVIYEVMTGNIPFCECNNMTAIPKIMAGIRPERPSYAAGSGSSEALWKIVEASWKQRPEERCTIRAALDQLNKISRYWVPRSPSATSPKLEDGDDSDCSEIISDLDEDMVTACETNAEEDGPSQANTPRSPTSSRAVQHSRDESYFSAITRLYNVTSESEAATYASSSAVSLEPPSPLSPEELKQATELQDLDEKINQLRSCLESTSPGPKDYATLLLELGVQFSARFMIMGDVGDIDEAISCARGSLGLRPLGDRDRISTLHDLGVYLKKRLQKTGRVEDINEAILCARECLAIHSAHEKSLRELGGYLSTRFEGTGQIEDLDEVVLRVRKTLEAFPPGSIPQGGGLNMLGALLYERFLKLADIEDIDEAIGYGRRLLDSCPPGHIAHAQSLQKLGIYLSARFSSMGMIKDINDVILCARRLLEEYPPGHVLHPKALEYLAENLHKRFERASKLSDLQEEIQLRQQLLDSLVPGDPGRFAELYPLVELYTRVGGRKKMDLAEVEFAMHCGQTCLDSLSVTDGRRFKLRYQLRNLRIRQK